MAQEYVRVRFGERFGMLKVIWPSGRIKGKKGRAVLCVCDCGAPMVSAMVDALRRGRKTSCGCKLKRGRRTHGHTSRKGGHSVIYRTWQRIIDRCHNPRHKSYRFYGAKGRQVHQPWRESFAAFLAYVEAELGPRPEGWTIDRIGNDGNYEPGNIRWADWETQCQNR